MCSQFSVPATWGEREEEEEDGEKVNLWVWQNGGFLSPHLPHQRMEGWRKVTEEEKRINWTSSESKGEERKEEERKRNERKEKKRREEEMKGKRERKGRNERGEEIK